MLHRTVVEIRDSIAILSRYASPADQKTVEQQSPCPATQLALRLALAWQAKSEGRAPAGGLIAQRSTATDLREEADELVKLASRWRDAKGAAADLVRASETHRECGTTAAKNVGA